MEEETTEMSERLTSQHSPVNNSWTFVQHREEQQTSCWQEFSGSLSRFCGLAEEEEEEIGDKWKARLEDIQKDKLIGHGKKPDTDEVDAAPRIRCPSSTPISLMTPSKRCRRITLAEGRQPGLIAAAVDGFRDLLDKKPKKSKRKPQLRSRSFAPAAIREFGQPRDYRDNDVDIDELKGHSVMTPRVTLNDGFFSDPIGSSTIYRRRNRAEANAAEGGKKALEAFNEDEDEVDHSAIPIRWEELGDWRILSKGTYGKAKRIEPEALGFEAGFEDEPDYRDNRRSDYEMRRPEDDFNRINKVGFNSDRRQINQGWFARLLDQGIMARLFDFKLTTRSHKHRPLFSIWMTFVQVLIFIVSLSVYGIAPIGFDERIVSKEIIQPNLALKLESYREKENLWIGPRQADLIKLGAKFSPCMRRDKNVYTAIKNDRVLENSTACCIYNDGSGCVQTTDDGCSDTLATWQKWSAKNPGGQEKNRVSGSVCGQDPTWCKSPASVTPFIWPDDITRWPVCQEQIETTSKRAEDRHATCDVVGRPCCMGIQGECVITTREHCNFYRGHFHEEATLCSQVNCMKDICGMLPFGNPQVPDQFYRLWTCLFLHAGLIHLVITVLFNLFVMVSLEKNIGWIRVVLIYMGSGVCGSLASAIFVPYHVEAGASGSQFGLLATQLVLVIVYTEEAWQAAWKILVLILVLLIIGLLPMVDNYAHIFGFVFGLLLSFTLLPFARFKHVASSKRTQRIVTLVVCSVLAVGLTAILIIFFYVAPVYNCPGCQYFNCIPFTPTFCETMEVKIRGVSTL